MDRMATDSVFFEYKASMNENPFGVSAAGQESSECVELASKRNTSPYCKPAPVSKQPLVAAARYDA